MTRRRGGLSDDDHDLWRLVTSTVRPLRGRAKAPPRPIHHQPAPAPASVRALRDAPSPASPPPQSTAKRAPVAPPADRSSEKRVRRGRVEIWGSLDLHGLTQDQARAAVSRFIVRAASEGARTIIVVTGKGGRFGGGEGVLRRRFPDWLADPGVRGLVSGLAPAHAKHGGHGAFYVFLKAQEPRDAFS